MSEGTVRYETWSAAIGVLEESGPTKSRWNSSEYICGWRDAQSHLHVEFVKQRTAGQLIAEPEPSGHTFETAVAIVQQLHDATAAARNFSGTPEEIRRQAQTGVLGALLIQLKRHAACAPAPESAPKASRIQRLPRTQEEIVAEADLRVAQYLAEQPAELDFSYMKRRLEELVGVLQEEFEARLRRHEDHMMRTRHQCPDGFRNHGGG